MTRRRQRAAAAAALAREERAAWDRYASAALGGLLAALPPGEECFDAAGSAEEAAAMYATELLRIRRARFGGTPGGGPA